MGFPYFGDGDGDVGARNEFWYLDLFECNGLLRGANWHWFYTNSPPTSEGGPENLDNAFARTGRWELVKIRARAPIIVLDLCFSLCMCFLAKHVNIQSYLS